METMLQFERFMRESNLIEGECTMENRALGRLWANDAVVCRDVCLMGKAKAPLTLQTLFAWHAALWEGWERRDPGGGVLRKAPVVVRSNGRVVWRAPNPGSLRRLMFLLLDDLPRLDAWAAHNRFEKIHPFIDGNGRMGRLLWLYCMVRDGDDPFALPFLHLYYYQTLRHAPEVA